jgi:hypothetical protein
MSSPLIVMKTVPFIPFTQAFNGEQVLEGTKIAAEEVDLYERPADTIGQHVITYECTQKRVLGGKAKREIRVDFLRKRFSITGPNNNGISFECRGTQVTSWAADPTDLTLVRVNIQNKDPQEVWIEKPGVLQAFFDNMQEFQKVCRLEAK